MTAPDDATCKIAETDDERRAALRISREAVMPDACPLRYEAARLRSPLRQRGDWWLRVDPEGGPVASLVCHPLVFARGDATRRGFGLASVATTPGARRRGHASRLCAAVAAANDARGRHVGLLFSAIPPAFYARLGYAVIPSWSFHADDLERIAQSGPRAPLRPLDPYRDVDHLTRAWRAGHPGLRMHRDAEGWAASLRLNQDDLFFAVGDGYVRLWCGARAVEVAEIMATDPDPALRAAAALGVDAGCEAIETWHPTTPLLRAHFKSSSRARTLPMLRGVAPAEGHDARFWGTDYF